MKADPLDTFLQQQFDAAMPSPSLAEVDAILHRIRRQQRLRQLVFAVAILVGCAVSMAGLVTMLSVMPALPTALLGNITLSPSIVLAGVVVISATVLGWALDDAL